MPCLPVVSVASFSPSLHLWWLQDSLFGLPIACNLSFNCIGVSCTLHKDTAEELPQYLSCFLVCTWQITVVPNELSNLVLLSSQFLESVIRDHVISGFRYYASGASRCMANMRQITVQVTFAKNFHMCRRLYTCTGCSFLAVSSTCLWPFAIFVPLQLKVVQDLRRGTSPNLRGLGHGCINFCHICDLRTDTVRSRVAKYDEMTLIYEFIWPPSKMQD